MSVETLKSSSGVQAGVEPEFRAYSNLLDLPVFFAGFDDYAVLRLPDDFPNYSDYSDLDILCRDRDRIANHILTIGRYYERRGFRIKLTRMGAHLFVDFFPPGATQLNFRFDLLTALSYDLIRLDPSFAQQVLDHRRTIVRNGVQVQVPVVEEDYAIRFMEFYEWKDRRPDKVKHWYFLARQPDFRFVDVINRSTNLALQIDRSDGKLNLNIQIKKNQPPSTPTNADMVKSGDGRKEAFRVNGIDFDPNLKTTNGMAYIGFSPDYLIKIEHHANARKLLDIGQESEVIRALNEQGCMSCPRLHSSGTLPNGDGFLIVERIHEKGPPPLADMIFALLEQKSFGVYQGDFKPANALYDGTLCSLIDYDQAQWNEAFKSMGHREFIDWIAQDFKARRGHDFFTNPERNFDREAIDKMFTGDAFNVGLTALLRNQLTTNTRSGLYHALRDPRLVVDGARSLDDRRIALNRIVFRRGEKVLDVGCNLGLLAHYLADRGCAVTGVDLDRNVILAARMTANILGKKIRFLCADMDREPPEERFDSLALFSVLHHLQNMAGAIHYISTHCDRILLESRLHESGSKPVDGEWVRTNGWNFRSLDEMVEQVGRLFTGFRFDKYYGKVDRERHVWSYVRG